VVVCLNYGGRQEIVDAVNGLLKRGFKGEITEELISANLYRPEIPDPDLVIRTSGELRMSNFLLWGSAYAELYFTDTLWPDFGGEDLQKALDQYSGRERRYGAV
jgi:undecaprenyl diphosphate synthase